MVHPTIVAEEFRYQIWPNDESHTWYLGFP
jgi:hypothetical protein